MIGVQHLRVDCSQHGHWGIRAPSSDAVRSEGNTVDRWPDARRFTGASD